MRKIREQLDLNQEQLAEALGYSRNYISMIEGGREPGKSFVKEWLTFEQERGIGSEHKLAADGPRGTLRAALKKAGMKPAALAKKIGYEAGVVQAVVEGGARISEPMAEKIVRVLPELDLEALLGGSETPRIMDETGMRGTMGSKPSMESGGMSMRMIPLISWSQAGAGVNFEDDAYNHEAIGVFNVPDRKAFAVQLRGDSMEPRMKEGDAVVVCPSWTPRNGDVVIARTIHGDVMCKIYQTKSNEQFVILSSYNSAHPPVELSRDEIAWIYPVHSVQQTLRRD